MPPAHHPTRLLAWAAVGASPIDRAFAPHWNARTGAAIGGICDQTVSKHR
jgi:hypothetical protein